MKCLPELPLLVGIQKVYSTRINTASGTLCGFPRLLAPHRHIINNVLVYEPGWPGDLAIIDLYSG